MFMPSMHVQCSLISLVVEGCIGRMSDDSQGKTRMKFEVPRRGLLEFGLEIAMAKCGTSGYEINRARVGASLLVVVGLDDLILHPDMAQYEDAMVRCALDKEWFNTVCQRLISLKDASPLFDTERWVHNLEAEFRKMTDPDLDGGNRPDIVATDNLR